MPGSPARGGDLGETLIFIEGKYVQQKYSTSSTCQFNYTDHARLQPLPKPTKGRHFPDASFHKNCSNWKIPVIVLRVSKVILEITTEMEVRSIICETLIFLFFFFLLPSLPAKKSQKVGIRNVQSLDRAGPYKKNNADNVFQCLITLAHSLSLFF